MDADSRRIPIDSERDRFAYALRGIVALFQSVTDVNDPDVDWKTAAIVAWQTAQRAIEGSDAGLSGWSLTRKRRREKGLCVSCGHLSPEPDRQSCLPCLMDSVERTMKWKKKRKEMAGG